ncbi:MAG: methionine gamma-lyase family protein [Clostridia bacterium]|nr:methionine gamma-lyase family protein [Clostridia bacterium]
MNISEQTRKTAEAAEEALAGIFKEINRNARLCTEKVLDVFRENKVSESLFVPTTGYGYGDRGRDTIDKIAAELFGAEAGFMRPSILSGTHALTVGLFGLLRPGDVMLSVTGTPYDTLRDVIGITGKEGNGSLRDFGVEYAEVPFKNGDVDFDGIEAALKKYGKRVKTVFIQRSKGYMDRKTLSVSEITEIVKFAREKAEGEFFAVLDNCYGEFTEETEPCDIRYGKGAVDLMIGSLIKNPGGGMADIGGYLVGSEKAVELAGYRLTCPGVGLEVGASLGQNRNLLRGLFYAPHTTAQALMTAHLAAYIFEDLGYEVDPAPFEKRHDIIQTVKLRSPEGLVEFCRGIQSASPVDAFVSPEPWDMPGYDDEVVMAAGAFVGGSSIELSADGPMREPYIAFMQGGLTYESARLAIMAAAERCGKFNG